MAKQFFKREIEKYYLNAKNGMNLNDNKILEAIDEAKSLYEDGAIIETSDILEEIINAIRLFDMIEMDGE